MRFISRFKSVFGCDLRTLALFRVCLGGVIIADLILRARDLTAHYSDQGIMPRAELLGPLQGWRPSLHLATGSAWGEGILFLIAGLFALAMVVGYRTRLAALVSWLFLISLQARNPILVQGGDDLLRMLLFWSMFLPLGARFSVDGALDPTLAERPNAYFSVATLALEIQCMSVYFFGALLKTSPVWIPDGTAVSYALHLDYLATPFAVWFRDFSVLTQGLTYFVWHLQLIGSVLMFSPLFHLPIRLCLQAAFMSMHIGFTTTLAIGLFPYISMTSLLAFTPSRVWDWLGERVRTPERRGVRIYYDEDCGFCKKTCLILRSLLLLPRTPIRPAQGDPEINAVLRKYNTWVVLDHDDSQHLRWQGIVLVFRRSILFAPLAILFDWGPIEHLGQRIYTSIANNLAALGRLTAHWLPYRTLHIDLSPPASVAVAALAALVFYFNLQTINAAPWPPAGWMNEVRTTLRLNQIWNMFAPAPPKIDGWYVIPGELGDDRVIDAFNDRLEPPIVAKPEYVSHSYPNYRWRKYLSRTALGKNYEHRRYFAQYLCTRWNNSHPKAQRLERLKIYFNRQTVNIEGLPRDTKRMLLWRHECFGENPDPFSERKVHDSH